ncbi:hypothetical protein RYH80_01625 [Halobaculum sp. MBLA0147]|uniref:hypothetical protein n=1 Tax=Halobaculum sp. MBLA0147 TaxID=3079934 RepID=UPI0035263F78
MGDDEHRQATIGADGELSERSPDADATNDLGEPKGAEETDGGFSRYAVGSLLQKAVRRSDEEAAAWAAWELARSGFAWNVWERCNLYVVEDLAAGQQVALTVARYEELATERWEPESWRGRLCAIHAALACARARSSREAANADEYFGTVAEIRADAIQADEEPPHDFPVGEFDPDGEYEAVFDGHTAAGTERDRGSAFFKTRGARVGPEGESELSARWQRLNMLFHDADFDEATVEHALDPVDDEEPWDDPPDAVREFLGEHDE